jgi:hypothetical protein
LSLFSNYSAAEGVDLGFEGNGLERTFSTQFFLALNLTMMFVEVVENCRVEALKGRNLSGLSARSVVKGILLPKELLLELSHTFLWLDPPHFHVISVPILAQPMLLSFALSLYCPLLLNLFLQLVSQDSDKYGR